MVSPPFLYMTEGHVGFVYLIESVRLCSPTRQVYRFARAFCIFSRQCQQRVIGTVIPRSHSKPLCCMYVVVAHRQCIPRTLFYDGRIRALNLQQRHNVPLFCSKIVCGPRCHLRFHERHTTCSRPLSVMCTHYGIIQ